MSLSTRSLTNALPGHHMPWMAGTLDLLSSHTDVIQFGYGTHTHAECICNTVSWFPTKVMMLLTSSNDLILTSICNIMAALHNPLPGSPLAPLTESHVTALKQLTDILTGIATNPAPGGATTNPTATVPAPAPTTMTSPMPTSPHLSPDDPPAEVENTHDPSLRVVTWVTPIDMDEPTTTY